MAKLTEQKLRDIIRELIDELLKEVTQTGDVAGYNTPYAFTGPMDPEKAKKWGKKKAKDTATDWEVIGDVDKPDKMNEVVSKEAKDEVMSLLKQYNGKEIPDEKVHALAEKLKVSPHELESFVYSLASAHVAESINEAIQYKTIDLRSEKGFKEAEKLQKQGWKTGSVGLYTIQMYKDASKNENKIAEGRYREFKEDSTLTPKQKLGYSLRMIRDNLCEIDDMIDINLRLKTESELDSGDYWKQSHRALQRIEEKMGRIITKIKKFY